MLVNGLASQAASMIVLKAWPSFQEKPVYRGRKQGHRVRKENKARGKTVFPCQAQVWANHLKKFYRHTDFSFIEGVSKSFIVGCLMNFLFLPYDFFSHPYCYFTCLLLLYLSPSTLPKNCPLHFPYQLNCTLLLPYTFLPPSAIFTLSSPFSFPSWDHLYPAVLLSNGLRTTPVLAMVLVCSGLWSYYSLHTHICTCGTRSLQQERACHTKTSTVFNTLWQTWTC